jgi:hypothetical protein
MCDKSVRMIIKQGSGVPTIPTSADHRNGDWIATDIYQGEMYLDTDTGLFYTRNGSGIVSNGTTTSKIYKAIINQTSTNDPVETYLIQNSIGTLTWSRVSTGYYKVASVGLFTVDQTFFYQPSPKDSGIEIVIRQQNDSEIRIYTYTGGVLTDGLLTKANIQIEVYG